MTVKLLLAVAAGGAVGSVARFAVTSALGRWLGTGFPWGTLTVNVVGSFAMGFLVAAVAQRWSLSPEVRALLFTGLLGGFTTFSAFSLDLYTLVERGAWGSAALYGTSSVVVGVFGLVLGLMVARWTFG